MNQIPWTPAIRVIELSINCVIWKYYCYDLGPSNSCKVDGHSSPLLHLKTVTGLVIETYFFIMRIGCASKILLTHRCL